MIAKNLRATVDGNGFSFVFGAKSHKRLIVVADLVQCKSSCEIPFGNRHIRRNFFLAGMVHMTKIWFVVHIGRILQHHLIDVFL